MSSFYGLLNKRLEQDRKEKMTEIYSYRLKTKREMEYGAHMDKSVVLEEGKCRGYDYKIISFGTHPCAYIKVDQNNLLFGKFYTAVDNDDTCPAHGGFTYCNGSTFTGSTDTMLGAEDSQGWWFGWDYSHTGDYNSCIPDIGGKKWTVAEIRQNVAAVAHWLEKYEK